MQKAWHEIDHTKDTCLQRDSEHQKAECRLVLTSAGNVCAGQLQFSATLPMSSHDHKSAVDVDCRAAHTL